MMNCVRSMVEEKEEGRGGGKGRHKDYTEND